MPFISGYLIKDTNERFQWSGYNFLQLFFLFLLSCAQISFMSKKTAYCTLYCTKLPALSCHQQLCSSHLSCQYSDQDYLVQKIKEFCTHLLKTWPVTTKKVYTSVYSLHCSCVDSAFKLVLKCLTPPFRLISTVAALLPFLTSSLWHYLLVYVIISCDQLSSRISIAAASGSTRPQKLICNKHYFGL